ncbi:MAG TPA: hypothetical protein DCQ06_10825 [Myxococcales bacterium]|nr:hypothetical protein [Myxococcales bacterium]HAN32080.1 hypothetical protein [Myxococcales bacterium]
MAKRREIQFTIDDEGNVSLQVKGVEGADCESLTRDIEEALGVVRSRERTSEYYIPSQTEETLSLEDE